MNELTRLIPPTAAGLAIGAFFFGGLWWTVTRGLYSERPALWFFGSWMLRTGVALAGFYFVGREDWQRWSACLLAFIAARLLVQRLTRCERSPHAT
jgi:F1F0 ATPase subunit 2